MDRCKVSLIAPPTVWTLVAVLALVLLPGVVSAGGVAVILDPQPTAFESGKAFTISFLVRSAHEDRSPITGLQPVVKLTKGGSEEHLTVTAEPGRAAGYYTAVITLPSAGQWRWAIHPFGSTSEEFRSTQPPLSVRAPGEVAPVAAAPPTGPLQDAKARDDATQSWYEPTEMLLTVGTTVRWHNGGKLPHTVTSTDGRFASGTIEPGQTFEYTFAEPGAYAYYCEYHGRASGQGQYGRVVVTAAQATNQAPVEGTQPAANLLNQASAGAAAGALTPQLPAIGAVTRSIGAAMVGTLLLGLLGRRVRRRRTHVS